MFETLKSLLLRVAQLLRARLIQEAKVPGHGCWAVCEYIYVEGHIFVYIDIWNVK